MSQKIIIGLPYYWSYEFLKNCLSNYSDYVQENNVIVRDSILKTLFHYLHLLGFFEEIDYSGSPLLKSYRNKPTIYSYKYTNLLNKPVQQAWVIKSFTFWEWTISVLPISLSSHLIGYYSIKSWLLVLKHVSSNFHNFFIWIIKRSKVVLKMHIPEIKSTLVS